MKKVTDLVFFTLFFSSLVGLGFTAGIFAYFGVVDLIGRVLS